MFSTRLQQELQQYHLLTHPFYIRWQNGELTKEELQVYGQQYYHHVEAFPRYISAIHSKCADIASRQVLLGNLMEEELGEENHPELWLRFCEALNVSRQAVKGAELLANTKALVQGFFELANSSYAEGLAALFAYEQQVPAVAKSKIEGLFKFYGIDSEDGLKFFKVHLTADEWHSEECAALLDKLSPQEQEKAREAGLKAAKLLWGFLDGVNALPCHATIN